MRFAIYHSEMRIDARGLVCAAAKGPNISRVQVGKGAEVQASSRGYRLVRPYQLGNRSGKRSSVNERRAGRMARPERGRAR